MFNKKGLILDTDNNRYKRYVSVLFFNIGDWKPLQKISYVALTSVLSKTSLWAAASYGVSGPVEVKGKLYCVFLCSDSKN